MSIVADAGATPAPSDPDADFRAEMRRELAEMRKAQTEHARKINKELRDGRLAAKALIDGEPYPRPPVPEGGDAPAPAPRIPDFEAQARAAREVVDFEAVLPAEARERFATQTMGMDSVEKARFVRFHRAVAPSSAPSPVEMTAPEPVAGPRGPGPAHVTAARHPRSRMEYAALPKSDRDRLMADASFALDELPRTYDHFGRPLM